MNKSLCIFSLLAVTTMFGQDQERRGRREGFGPPGGFMRMNPALAALDADNDGTISAAELSNAPAALKSLDKDGDGKISPEEMRPNFGGRGPGGPGGPGMGQDPEEMVKRLMEFDRNSDGVLTKDELPERMQGLMARADANQDGKLTKEEITKSAQTMRGPGGPGGPGGPDGRRGGPGMMRMDRVFAALDADQDGSISTAEMTAAAKALAKLDQNGDGKLTEDEVRPNFGPGGPGGRGRREQ